MYGKLSRQPTIQVAISLGDDSPQVHPRMADMCCKIENELAYIEEHGSGGEHTEKSLDFLERVWKALQKAPTCHPVRAKLGEQIKAALTKYRPACVTKEQE